MRTNEPRAKRAWVWSLKAHGLQMVLALGCLLAGVSASNSCAASTAATALAERGYVFLRDTVASVPWSVDIVKVSRRHPNLELDTALGHGTMLGVAVVSQQMQLVPRELGRPVAGINGDMFQSSYTYRGDPDGLQIVHGELVSAPHPTRVCVWLDGQGNPHRTNVLSRFHVIWPNGAKMAFGLNEERDSDMVVL